MKTQRHYHIQFEEREITLSPGCGILADVINRLQRDRQENNGRITGKWSFKYTPLPTDYPDMYYRERIISCTKSECEQHPDFYADGGGL